MGGFSGGFVDGGERPFVTLEEGGVVERLGFVLVIFVALSIGRVTILYCTEATTGLLRLPEDMERAVRHFGCVAQGEVLRQAGGRVQDRVDDLVVVVLVKDVSARVEDDKIRIGLSNSFEAVRAPVPMAHEAA